MGFEVLEAGSRPLWVPVDYGTSGATLYTGQIVRSTGDGVAALGSAAGAFDTTNKNVPFGVVVGTDNLTPTYNTTYQAESVTSVSTSAAQAARSIQGAEGMWIKNDLQAKVQVVLITAQTVLKGRIFKTSYGTALSTLTVSNASADGGLTAPTMTAADFTPVADLTTLYCRTGGNAGAYRIVTNTSTTQPTVAVAFPNATIAVGDTFVWVPIRPIGTSYVNFDSASTFINGAASPATNYYGIEVLELNLSLSGQEYVVFRFNSVHFDPARA